MEIRRLRDDELPEAAALLRASALPAEDLAAAAPVLLGARDAPGLAGVVGVERLGTVGLLRSLAVRPDLRGTGLGGTLTRAAETLAAGYGIAELFLLTTTAEEFFARRGYTRRERDSVPAAVRATTEFASVCPATAVVMGRRLTPGP